MAQNDKPASNSLKIYIDSGQITESVVQDNCSSPVVVFLLLNGIIGLAIGLCFVLEPSANTVLGVAFIIEGVASLFFTAFIARLYMYMNRKTTYYLSNIQGRIEKNGSTVKINPSQNNDQSQIVCPSCKKPVSSDTKFCRVCGFDIGEYNQRLQDQ